MLKRCGNIRAWHFAHDYRYENDVNKECSYESYLHAFAKLRLKQWFEESESIILHYQQSMACKYAKDCIWIGCGDAKDSTEKGSAGGDSYTVGISQFAEHGSLDNCREGFIEGLKEEGIEEGKNLKIDYQNAQTDTGTASTIADSFISEKVDMICAIATPCAASAYNSAMNADTPVVYTAVSDPVAAGLANDDGTSVGNITGSSDILPVEEQLKMIRQMMPDAKKIGILYTTSEANSCSTIEEYKKLAGDYDFEIVDTGINTSADVEIAAADLVTKVDCLCNLTDNTAATSTSDASRSLFTLLKCFSRAVRVFSPMPLISSSTEAVCPLLLRKRW